MAYDPNQSIAPPWDSGPPAPRQPNLDFIQRLALALSQVQAPPPGGAPGDQFGANLLAGMARGFAAPHVQRMQQGEDDYQRRLAEYTQGQQDQRYLKRYGQERDIYERTQAQYAPQRNAPVEDVVQVVENGRTVYKPKSQAAGMSPPAPREPRMPEPSPVVIMGADGKPRYVRPGDAYGHEPAPATRQAPKPPTATDRDKITMHIAFADQINNIRKAYRPELTGPLSGGVRGKVGDITGIGRRKGESGFRAQVATLRNEILKLRSGGAVTDGEAARLLQELPTPDNPSENFEDKLDSFENAFRVIAQTHRDVLEGSGIDMSRMPQIPASTRVRARVVRDPVTGKLVRAQ